MTRQYVYFFGEGRADGNAGLRDTLGGKGAGLAEMTNAGIPVPPGFTISTDACRAYYDKGGGLPDEVIVQQAAALERLEGVLGAAWAMRPTRSSSRCDPAPSSPCRA